MLQQYFRILIIATLFIPASLMAQDDFVINAKGDTIKGRVFFHLMGRLEHVQVKGSTKQMLSPMNVREVFMRGERFKPVQFSGSIKFMKIIIDGYLSLLGFQLPGTMYYDGRLLQMRDSRMLEVPTFGFKRMMPDFVKDYPELASKIEDGTLGRKELDKIITEYNKFISGRTTTMQVQAKNDVQQNSKLDILNELRSGVQQSSMDSKKDLLDLLLDMEEKIKSNKTVPPYLIKLIGDSLQTQPDLTTKFNDLVKSLQ